MVRKSNIDLILSRRRDTFGSSNTKGGQRARTLLRFSIERSFPILLRETLTITTHMGFQAGTTRKYPRRES